MKKRAPLPQFTVRHIKIRFATKKTRNVCLTSVFLQHCVISFKVLYENFREKIEVMELFIGKSPIKLLYLTIFQERRGETATYVAFRYNRTNFAVLCPK